MIHANIRICLGGHEVTTSRGVPQGLITSPDLFNIYVEPLLQRLEMAGIFSRMFADDLVLIAHNLEEAKRGIEIVR